MCKLINNTSSVAKNTGDTIYDVAGRPWQYEFCIGAARHDPAKVVVRRLTNNKPAVRSTEFALSFFPQYRVSVTP